MMKTKIIAFLLLLFSLIASACNGVTLTATTGPQVKTWIDAPLQNAAIPVAPYQLVFHGTSFAGVNEFEVSVNGQVEGLVAPLSTDSGGPQGNLFYSEYEWTPTAPGTYLISVRAKDGDQEFGPAAEVVVVVGDVLAKESDAVEVQPTSTDISADEDSCTYTALVNLFCRNGPGKVYVELDSFTPDTVADVIGISPDGSHAQVIGPNFGKNCFVPVEGGFGELDGACDELEVVQIPPTPTLTPTVTFTPEPAKSTATPSPTLPQCNDGIDNDGDGQVDMSDHECLTTNDNDESH